MIDDFGQMIMKEMVTKSCEHNSDDGLIQLDGDGPNSSNKIPLTKMRGNDRLLSR